MRCAVLFVFAAMLLVLGSGCGAPAKESDQVGSREAEAEAERERDKKEEFGEQGPDLGNPITEERLGLPFYPGSTEVLGSFMEEVPTENRTTLLRSTSDAPAKVIAFYKDKMLKPAATGNKVTGANALGWRFTVSATPANGKTLVKVFTVAPATPPK